MATDLHQIPDVDKEKFDEYLIVGHVPCNRLNVDMSNKFYRTDYYMCIDAGAGYKEHGGNLACYCVTTDKEICESIIRQKLNRNMVSLGLK